MARSKQSQKANKSIKEKELQDIGGAEGSIKSTSNKDRRKPKELAEISESEDDTQDEEPRGSRKKSEGTKNEEKRTFSRFRLPPEDENDDDEEPDSSTDSAIDETDGSTHQCLTILCSVLVVFIAVIAVIIAFLAPRSIDKADIETNLKQLENDFQNQSLQSFRKLKSRVLSYVEHRTSPQPFVLLVASAQDDQLTAKCFATRVAQLLTTSTVTINGSEYSTAVSDNAKLEIDDKLRSLFSKGKFPSAAIIHNLDMIPYGTTNLFYAYCDHNNPMYKEAAIIFTITLLQSYEVTLDEVAREGLVEKYLSNDSPWVKDKTFSSDIMGALISRITDIVIVVNKESKEVMEKLC